MSFCPIESPIFPELTLLEASAGTGKTYSLVRIIARHLVEKDIPLQEVLTVTFTRAATAEIKERLHQLLHEILTELRGDEEALKNDLAQKWNSKGPDFKTQAIKSLALALSHFDTVPIFTIDGFFQRLLKEYAFESNSLFSVELDTDEAAMVDQALRDYWRTHIYKLNEEDLTHFNTVVDFSQAATFISEVLRTPDAVLSPSYSLSAKNLVANQAEQYIAFKDFLTRHKEELLHFVTTPPQGLAKRKQLYKAGGAETFEIELEKFLTSKACTRPNFLSDVSSDYLFSKAAATKALKEPLSEHSLAPVFEAISAFLNTPQADLKSAYLGEILRTVKKQLGAIKKERNVQTYTDITSKLASLLTSDSKPAQNMIKSVRASYQATLIDEFQDTSPLQSAVFLSLFNHPEGYLHIIGDPKQSIYRFRGADVYAYINAAKKAKTTERLVTNYRSTPSMIHAVNILFSRAADPFLIDEQITFHPSTWPNAEADNSPTHPSLHFHSLDSALRNNERFNAAIEGDITQQILDLLGQSWERINPGDSARSDLVHPGDIAILVNSKKEGANLFHHLSQFGIPAVIQTSTSLLDTDEATDILYILHAALHPNKPAYIRTALLCSVFGDNESLLKDQAFLSATEHFLNFSIIWEQQGLMPMIRALFKVFDIHPRLLSLPQGIRSLTNFMHLSEVLDNKSRSEGYTPTDITLWLDSAIKGHIIDTDAEVLEIRLDSDLPSVKILTQHSSKGLEFPIVFVTPPCKRTFSNTIKPDLSYHDAGTLHLAAQSEIDEEVLAKRVREACADRARLAYVSITRAKYLCHFYYIPEHSSKPDEHAVYQMLGCPDLEDLHALGAKSDGCIQINEIQEILQPQTVYTPPIQEQVQELRAGQEEDTQWSSQFRTTSFSGLTHHNHSEESYRDIDRSSSSSTQLEEVGFWKDLQAGAALGSAFHEILEEVDFQRLEGMDAVILQKLTNYQPFKKHFQKAKTPALVSQISQYIQHLVCHPLESNPTSVTLNAIPDKQRIIEPQFVLTDSTYSLSQLAKVLKSAPPKGLPADYIGQLENMDSEAFKGFLTGFIDLIFEHDGRYHILDWKTNRLKNPVTQYSDIALCSAMADHHYYLQYHLYTLALDTFLQLRLGDAYQPEKHLGKVYYVFLRGIDPNTPGSGVFSDQLSLERLQQLRSIYQPD